MNTKIGFIGCGNMGTAIVNGLVESGSIDSKNIFIIDKDKEKEKKVIQKLGVSKSKSIKELCTNVDYIVLAVKPDMVPSVLKELDFQDSKILISIAAGITMKTIKKSAKGFRIVRVMPNTPAFVKEGMTAICCEKSIKEKEKEYINQIFNSIGKVIEIDEKYFNAVTALSGSGPAYVFVFIEAMADAAVRMGLTRETAYNLAAQTVLGSAKLVLETGKHPGQLKDMVCSPAGTTIEAIYQLEKRGFRGTVMKAIGECFEKAEEMSEEIGD